MAKIGAAIYNDIMEKLLIIATGGTIDSAYDPQQGTPENVPTPEHSAIPFALARLGYAADGYDFYRYCHRDSKHIGDRDISHIIHFLSEHPEYAKVIVIHGTDTMPRNARHLQDALQGSGMARTVIFCGSMKPLRREAGETDIFLSEAQSDGWINLRTAMEQVSSLPPGVYLTDGAALREAWKTEKHRDLSDSPAGRIVTQAKFVERVQPPGPEQDHFIRIT